MPQIKVAKEISRRDILFSMARIPGTERCWVGSSDFKLYEFDFGSSKSEPLSEPLSAHESYVTGVARGENGFVTGSFDQRLVWWDSEVKRPIKIIENAHQRFIRSVCSSLDGKWIASVGDDMVARVWESGSGVLRHELQGHAPKTPHHFPSMLYACAFSPDAAYLATVDRVGTILVWNLANGEIASRMEAPELYTWDPKQRRHSIGGIRSVAFSPDGKSLAVGGIGQIGNIDHLDAKARIEIFDWQKKERTHLYADNPKGLVESLVFHPNQPWLCAAGGDSNGFVLLFDLTDPKKAILEQKAPMHVHSIALDETGSSLYAAGHGKLVKWTIQIEA